MTTDLIQSGGSFRLHTAYLVLSVLGLMASPSSTSAATLYVDSSRTSQSVNTYPTIAQAISKLNPGDTVVIGDGVYRESIDLRQSRLPGKEQSSLGSTRFESAPGTHPIIKGSDVVQGWQRVDHNVFARPDWTVNSQQVFVNGNALKQIGGVIFGDFPLNPKHPFAALHRSQGGIWPGRNGNGFVDLVAESFYYDAAAKILYVKTAVDITRGQTVEVSTRPYLVIGTAVDHVEFHGLAFAHANTTAVSQSGAISLSGNYLTLDNIAVRDVDGAGIDVTGDHNTVSHSLANYCGIVGMKVRGRNSSVADNETSFNNTRGFNKWWEAGGAKFVGAGGLQDSQVSGHRAYQNQGDGLWFDWHNDNNRIHDNISAYNAGMGIHYEASRKGLIYDNYVFGNAQRGIYLPNSSQSVIAHNLVAANGMDGIVIVDERRAVKEGIADLIPSDNSIVANVVARNAKAALILPADVGNRSDDNLFIDSAPPKLSLGWPSREHPLIQGIDHWRDSSGQDGKSRWSQSALSPALQVQLDARQPLSTTMRAEWQLMTHAASTQRVSSIPEVDADLTRPGSAPGPAL